MSAKNNINIKEVFLAIAKKLPLNDKLNDTTGVKVNLILNHLSWMIRKIK